MILPKALAQGIAAIAVKRGLFKQTVGWVDIDQSPNTQGHSAKLDAPLSLLRLQHLRQARTHQSCPALRPSAIHGNNGTADIARKI
jgi:hypothetical protein